MEPIPAVMERKQLTFEDYTVGWVCALPKELTAASAMLEEEHEDLPLPLNDENTYYLGSIGLHNVVIAGLPKGGTGNNSAATVATRMVATFKSIRFGLLVGIGGGVPSRMNDIRLGDVVVSTPTGQHGGVVQWDFGKTGKGAKFERTGSLNRPPAVLMTALAKLESIHNRQRSRIEDYLAEMASKYPKLTKKYATRPSTKDVLFEPDYDHVNKFSNCDECDVRRSIRREVREEEEDVQVHYGLVASGNQVMKHGASRDEISNSLGGVLCFEMEAAGLLNDFPCIVVRGICDYADSHKNKQWQEYAAATAAAFAKELLIIIPASQVTSILTADAVVTEGVRLLIENQNLREEAKEDIEFIRLFHNSNYEVYKNRNPERQEGTCLWFLEHPNYIEWRDSLTSTVLWVSADPGCGKSVLCRSLVDRDLKSTQSKTTCYFFFKDDDEDQQSLINAMCALIHQLLSQNKGLTSGIAKEVRRFNQVKALKSFPTLWKLFINAASGSWVGEVICILDALDECAQVERKLLIDQLKTFYRYGSSGRHKIKFLITSRPEFDIERGFGSLVRDFPKIHLAGEEESETISKEINIVIKAKVKEMAADLDLDESATSSLEMQLLKMTNRTYLWLKLIWEVIYLRLDATTEKRLRRIIDTIPPTLESAYEEILHRSRDKVLARKLLHVVLSAKRPLKLAEMNVALAIQKSSRSYEDLDLEPERLFKQRLRNACGLFVSVVDSKVYLIHQTAKEFLVQTAVEKARNSAWKNSFAELDSNFVLANACINYLGFSDFGQEASDMLEVSRLFRKNQWQDVSLATAERLMVEYVFLEYSANYWFEHFENATVDVILMEQALNLINTQSASFLMWFYIFRRTPINEIQAKRLSGLMVAAFCGSTRLLELQIKNGADITAIDQDGKAALDWLLAGMQLEYKSRIDRDDLSRYSRRRLSTLYYFLRKASIQVLLDTHYPNAQTTVSAADPSLKYRDNYMRGVLQESAAKLAHNELTANEKLEIQSGTREDIMGAEVCCTIMADRVLNVVQYQYSSENMISMEGIMESSSQFQFPSDNITREIDQITPHEVAALTLQTLEHFQQSHEDPNSRFLSALSFAAEIGYKHIAKMLLNDGVVETLFQAAGANWTGIMKILLASGANPNTIHRTRGEDDDWVDHTLIAAALMGGQTQTLEILLSYGCDPNLPMRTFDRRTGEMELNISPISMALSSGSADLLRCLLKYGADMNKYMSGLTPLHVAAANGNTSMARVLLQYGAELSSKAGRVENQEDFEGATALHFAAKGGHSRLVQLLLDKGIDADAVTKAGQTALEIARRKRHTGVVEILEKRLGGIFLSRWWRSNPEL